MSCRCSANTWCYAILALSLDLIWGHAGILSLGQAAFFALGGYCMGMYLMRQIGTRGVYQNPVLPDFMVFLQYKELPWFWYGFDHFAWAALMILVVPGLLAFVFGWLAFRSRACRAFIPVDHHPGDDLACCCSWPSFATIWGFGGNNGLTDYKDLLGFDEHERGTLLGLYLASVIGLGIAYLICRHVTKSKLGRILLALRDAESRVRFLGYSVTNAKLLVFTLQRQCWPGSPARSTCRKSASSTPANSRPAIRSRWRSGSRSAGAARYWAR